MVCLLGLLWIFHCAFPACTQAPKLQDHILRRLRARTASCFLRSRLHPNALLRISFTLDVCNDSSRFALTTRRLCRENESRGGSLGSPAGHKLTSPDLRSPPKMPRPLQPARYLTTHLNYPPSRRREHSNIIKVPPRIPHLLTLPNPIQHPPRLASPSHLPPLLHSPPKLIQRPNRRTPINTSVRHALPVRQPDRTSVRDRLLARDEVGFDHDAHDVGTGFRGTELGGDGGGDEALAFVLLFRVAVRAARGGGVVSACERRGRCEMWRWWRSRGEGERGEGGWVGGRREERTHQSIMILVDSLAFSRDAAVAATCSASKLGPLLDPRRMTWHEGFPSVSTTAGTLVSS